MGILEDISWVTIGVDRRIPHQRMFGDDSMGWADHRCLHMADYGTVHDREPLFIMEQRMARWSDIWRHDLLVCPICLFSVVGDQLGHVVLYPPQPPWPVIIPEWGLNGSPW